jgi:hypothetical protein
VRRRDERACQQTPPARRPRTDDTAPSVASPRSESRVDRCCDANRIVSAHTRHRRASRAALDDWLRLIALLRRHNYSFVVVVVVVVVNRRNVCFAAVIQHTNQEFDHDARHQFQQTIEKSFVLKTQTQTRFFLYLQFPNSILDIE